MPDPASFMPDGLSIDGVAEQLLRTINDARALGVPGVRAAAATVSTKWCMSFIQMFFDLASDLCVKAGLPEKQAEEAVHCASLALGLLLLLWGYKLIYKMLAITSVAVSVTVAAMAFGKDANALGVGLLAGLFAGWQIIAWYRRQLLSVCGALGGAAGAAVGFSILAGFKALLAKAKEFEPTAQWESVYHGARVSLHYPSLASGAACMYGLPEHCKELTLEDVVYLGAMVYIGYC